MVKNLPEMQETRVKSLGQEDPLEKEIFSSFWVLDSSFCPTPNPRPGVFTATLSSAEYSSSLFVTFLIPSLLNFCGSLLIPFLPSSPRQVCKSLPDLTSTFPPFSFIYSVVIHHLHSLSTFVHVALSLGMAVSCVPEGLASVLSLRGWVLPGPLRAALSPSNFWASPWSSFQTWVSTCHPFPCAGYEVLRGWIHVSLTHASPTVTLKTPSVVDSQYVLTRPFPQRSFVGPGVGFAGGGAF